MWYFYIPTLCHHSLMHLISKSPINVFKPFACPLSTLCNSTHGVWSYITQRKGEDGMCIIFDKFFWCHCELFHSSFVWSATQSRLSINFMKSLEASATSEFHLIYIGVLGSWFQRWNNHHSQWWFWKAGHFLTPMRNLQTSVKHANQSWYSSG